MKSKYENYFKIGDRYQKLVVCDDTVIMRKEAMVKVLCDCGNEKVVSACCLVNGRIISCGCEMNKKGHNHPEWSGTKNISGSILKRIKYSAKKRNLEYSISDDYLQSLIENQNFKCKITDLPLTTKTMSLDRIDSSFGYVEKNLRWVHKDINVMKNSYSDEYFFYMCKLVCKIKTDRPHRIKNDRRNGNKTRNFILKNDLVEHKFSTLEDVKSFVEEVNKSQNLNGPTRVSFGALYRKKKSNGWMLEKYGT